MRLAQNVSAFPAGVVAAASWDRDLAHTRGAQIGAEFKGKGSHIGLGPVVGPLGKNALDGRAWEGFSVDPYLTGVMSAQTVTGMQSVGVQSCTKHFVGNEQETNRGSFPQPDSTTISSNIDDATLHELYLWPFYDAVRAGTASVMCSYNKLNGTYACQNDKALNDILKTQLGFQGYIVSDWGAQHSGVLAANNGMDLAMPGGLFIVTTEPTFWREHLADAVNNGSVSQSRLDDAAIRFMTPYFALGQDSPSYPKVDPTSTGMSLFLFPDQAVTNSLVGGPSVRDVRQDHAELIRTLGAAATVLLKNDNGILPLSKPKSIGVFANDAGAKPLGDIQQTTNYYYGTLPLGGGSGTGHFPYVTDPLSALRARAAQDNTTITDFLDNDVLALGLAGPGSFLGLNISSPPDICLVFLKGWAEEASDRAALSADWSGDDVVQRVAARCPNTVVITHTPGPILMPWASLPSVRAILAAHYPGQEIGAAIVDVLYGATNPSGHLPYTIAHAAADYPSEPVPGAPYADNFTERLLIDYRWFDARAIAPLYPFGHGLSYTNFSISAVRAAAPTSAPLSPLPALQSRPAPGGNPDLWTVVQTVTATVANTGARAGAAVPQLYLSLGAGAPAGHPLRQLRGFDKVPLAPGESTTVTFALTRRDVSYWDVAAQAWRIPRGELGVGVGWSSGEWGVGTTGFTLVP